MTADREAGIAVPSPPPLPASSSSARAANAAEDHESSFDSFGDDGGGGGGGAFDFTCIAEDVDGGGIEAWAPAFPPSAFFAVTMSEDIPQFLPPNALSPPSYPTFFSPLGSPFSNSVRDHPNKNDENVALLGKSDREVVVVVGERHRRIPLNKRRWAAAQRAITAKQGGGIGSVGIRKMTRSLARGGNDDRDDAEEEKKRDGYDDKTGGINEAEATNEGFEYVPMGPPDDPEGTEGMTPGDEADDGAAVNGGKGGPPGPKAEAATTAATANASTSLRRRPFADFVKTLSAARRGSGGGLAVHPSAPLKTSPENVDQSAAEAKQGHPLPDRPLSPLADPSSGRQRLVATTTAEEGKETASGKKASRAAAPLELSDDDVEVDYRTPPLGGGAFCAIHPIRLLLRDSQTKRFDDDGGDRGRPQRLQSYALKRLRRAVVESTPAMRAAAVSGLRREASLLAECSHENVVRLHGTRRRRPREIFGNDSNDRGEDDENFFLVLERLEETLESRLEGWSRKRRMGRFGKHYASRATVTSRITDVALGIARGMEYLHSKNIIFRGLKPANIGFDHHGRVKLFNFALARKCDVDPATGRPFATGRMGTLRYMAPEVANAGRRRNGSGNDGSKSSGSYYTLSADVYSFALLLWQIVTSRVPYESEIPTTSVMMTAVVSSSRPIPDDKRPSLKYIESRELRALLERGWAARPELRPAFREVRSELERFLLGTKSEGGGDGFAANADDNDDVDADADADAEAAAEDDGECSEDEAMAPPPTAAPTGPAASPKVNAGSSSLLAAPPPALADEDAKKPPSQGEVTPSPTTAPPPSPSLADPQSVSESGHIAVPPERTGEIEVLELSDDDVKINYRALGSGAFCSVYPVHLKDKLTGEFDERRFALKRLRLAVLEDAAASQFAVQDLAREADILKDLRHENIIRLHGATRGEDRDESLRDGSFFIVMDVLADTLDSRLEGWAKKRRSRPLQRCTPREAVADRIRDVAVGIATGMEYLHSRDVIFRDLKPANVGFDDSGRVKIFDFGLAQKCDVDPATGSRVATGKVGTLRYMAPEVARGGRGTTGNNGDDAVCYYGPSADVFSFALLLWQIVTSRVPYEKEIPATSAMMVASPRRPIPERKRPPLKYVESDDLRALLESGWASDPDVRPAFRDVGGRLRDFVA